MTCPFCGSHNPVTVLEAWGHDWLPQTCCERLKSILSDFLTSYPDETRLLLQNALALPLRPTRVKINHYLTTRVLEGEEQKRVFEFINAHHRHHDAPVGWKFGMGIWNGPTLLGVAAVGNPVNRIMMARGFWEINRVCLRDLWPDDELGRHAASQVYAACRKEIRRRGGQKVLTYVLESESGVSLKAAGFVRVWRTKGGSWNTPSRPRTDKAPTDRKWLWVWPEAAAKQLLEARHAKKKTQTPLPDLRQT